MYIEDHIFNNPEFKRVYLFRKFGLFLLNCNFLQKLFAVDETVMNLCVDRNRPFPCPANIKMARFDNGIDCDEVFPGIIVGNAYVVSFQYTYC